MKSLYYIRVELCYADQLEEHLKRNNVAFEKMSTYFGSKILSSSVYSIRMESEDALNMKLSFPILGIMDFNKILGKPIDKSITVN